MFKLCSSSDNIQFYTLEVGAGAGFNIDLIHLPWLGSFRDHSLPFFPPPACTTSLPLAVTNP